MTTGPGTGRAFIGKPAPPFAATALLPDGSFKKISNKDFEGKYLYIFFWPLDFTFVCPTEITAFSDRYKEFKAINCEVLGVSVDSEYSHLAWTKLPRKAGGLGPMTIPLLADLTKKMSSDYGVLIEEEGVALRGSFIIDPKGILRQITINDLPIGRDVDEALRLVQAIQFTEEHGEVCPLGWKPGAKTMKADPVNSLEYFESLSSSADDKKPPAKKTRT